MVLRFPLEVLGNSRRYHWTPSWQFCIGCGFSFLLWWPLVVSLVVPPGNPDSVGNRCSWTWTRSCSESLTTGSGLTSSRSGDTNKSCCSSGYPLPHMEAQTGSHTRLRHTARLGCKPMLLRWRVGFFDLYGPIVSVLVWWEGSFSCIWLWRWVWRRPPRMGSPSSLFLFSTLRSVSSCRLHASPPSTLPHHYTSSTQQDRVIRCMLGSNYAVITIILGT